MGKLTCLTLRLQCLYIYICVYYYIYNSLEFALASEKMYFIMSYRTVETLSIRNNNNILKCVRMFVLIAFLFGLGVHWKITYSTCIRRLQTRSKAFRTYATSFDIRNVQKR